MFLVKHTKHKVTSGSTHNSFTKDKLCWEQQEPYFEEMTGLVGLV